MFGLTSILRYESQKSPKKRKIRLENSTPCDRGLDDAYYLKTKIQFSVCKFEKDFCCEKSDSQTPATPGVHKKCLCI